MPSPRMDLNCGVPNLQPGTINSLHTNEVTVYIPTEEPRGRLASVLSGSLTWPSLRFSFEGRVRTQSHVFCRIAQIHKICDYQRRKQLGTRDLQDQAARLTLLRLVGPADRDSKSRDGIHCGASSTRGPC